MTVTPNAILDVEEGIGQLAWEVTYDVLDKGLELIDTVHPLRATGVSMNVSGQVKRQLQGFVLSETDLDKVDLFQHRIKPWFTLEDGTRWPLGVFVFTAAAKHTGSYVSTLATTLMDQDYILSQPTRDCLSIAENGPILPVVTSILDRAKIYGKNRDIPTSSNATVGPSASWPQGTSRLKILQECCDLAGWLPPYFDNDGKLVIRTPPDLSKVAPDHLTYPGARVLRASLVENENLLSAPNVYLVIGTGPNQGAIAASTQVDAALPFSVENRGFEIVSVTRAQALQSLEQAQQMANSLAAGAGQGYKNVVFTGNRDPRHDIFQTVDWLGTVYRETQWDLGFGKNAFMKHTLTLGGFPHAG